MPLAFFIVTYSLKVNSILAFSRGKFVAPGKGLMPVIIGGMVSLRPPVGAWVVLAQEGLNIIGSSTIALARSGINAFLMSQISVRTTSDMPSILPRSAIMVSRTLRSITSIAI